MKTLFKLSLIVVALGTLASAALWADSMSGPLYKCPGDKALYENLKDAQKVCPGEVKTVHHRHSGRYYRVYDGDGYYYVYDDRPGVVGNVVEGAHEVASNIWHRIFG